jgi:hypothetical protein
MPGLSRFGEIGPLCFSEGLPRDIIELLAAENGKHPHVENGES